MTSLRDWGSRRDRDSLDKHITGNYGEDQFRMSQLQVTIDMPTMDPKKHSVRFNAADDDAPVTSIYLQRWEVENLGGCPNGVRVTIQPLPLEGE